MYANIVLYSQICNLLKNINFAVKSYKYFLNSEIYFTIFQMQILIKIILKMHILKRSL